MSADIQKMAVLDSRIVQSVPKYAVEKGALSLTNAPFPAIAATSSQHTYNIYVPSENVFVDRELRWSGAANMTFNVALSAAALNAAQPLDAIVAPGRDFSLCALPLNSLCSTMSATINDTTAVINSQDVMKEVIRLTDYKKTRLVRTAPTCLDKYALYDDAFGTLNNPLQGYSGGSQEYDVPNGAHYGLQFADNSNSVLPRAAGASAAAYNTPAFTGALYVNVNGVPCLPSAYNAATVYTAGQIVLYNGQVWRTAAGQPAGTGPGAGDWAVVLTAGTSVPIYIQWYSTEPLVLSPFVFSDTHEWDTGLFGINNIQLVMTLLANVSRVIRSTTRAGRTVSGVGFTSQPFVQGSTRINVQFLTPSLDVPLPPKSVVPYMEFPRYITQSTVAIAPYSQGQIASQTITLPQIPDLLIIYAKPYYTSDGTTSGSLDTTQGDWYLPIASYVNGNQNNPLSVNFDNFAGLLSSHTSEELYAMSVHNGLEMDWDSWSGAARSSAGPYVCNERSVSVQRVAGQTIPAVGGFLVLKPSQDITLQSGQAPSLVGNFTLQFNVSVYNPTATAITPQLYVITANSGFFETIRGSSRIIKGVLSEQDIISAPLAPHTVRSELDRVVGGLSFKSLGNIITKARDIYQRTKPIVSAVKEALPEEGMMGKVKGALGTVGYGTGGGTGAGTGGRKKSLASRLM